MTEEEKKSEKKLRFVEKADGKHKNCSASTAKWVESLGEDYIDDIGNYFYSNLRQENGLLIDFDDFLFRLWGFITPEGKKVQEEVKDYVESDIEEEGDEINVKDELADARFVVWREKNKTLAYDAHYDFYINLLEHGELIDFEDFIVKLWRFATPEGKKCLDDLNVEFLSEKEEKIKKEIKKVKK